MTRSILPRLALALLTLLPLVGAGACDPDPEAAAQVAPAAARWRVGDVHRYAVDWQVDTDLEVAGVLEGAQSAVRMRLTGEVILRVHPDGDGGVLLGLAWARLDAADLDVLGGPAWEDREAAARGLVGPEALCALAADGSIAAAYFDPDAPALFRHLMSGLLVHTDLRLPAPGAARWEATTPGSSGPLRARYHRDADDPAEIRRDLLEFAEVRAVPATLLEGARAEAEGSARARLGDRDIPESIDARESLRILDLEGGAPRYASVARFSMRRLASDHDPGLEGAAPALAGLRRQIPGEAVDDPEAGRDLAARFAAGLTVPAMLGELRLAGADMPVREGLILETTGLLRSEPAAAFAITPVFLDPATSAAARARIFDVLAAAGTAEAQAVIRTLLESEAAAADADAFAGLISRLAFITAPEPETVAALLALHRATAADPTSPVYLSTLYALGSVAKQAAARDPILAAPVHAVLVARLDRARTVDERLGALAGLGNLGSAGDLERILAWQGDPDPEVRTQVALSLRTADAPAARAALEALLGDREGDVATRALLSLNALTPTLAEAERLVDRIDARTIDARAHAALINVFAGWLGRRPELAESGRRGLLAIAARTPDPQLRADALAAAE